MTKYSQTARARSIPGILLCLLCLSWLPSYADDSAYDSAYDSAHDSQRLAEANNEFTFELLHTLSAGQAIGENIFISPYSIESVLGMTYAGAAGNTAAEMRQVLNFDRFPEGDPHAAFQLFMERMNTINALSGGLIQSHVAHGIWKQEDVPFLPSFVDQSIGSYLSDPAGDSYSENSVCPMVQPIDPAGSGGCLCGRQSHSRPRLTRFELAP